MFIHKLLYPIITLMIVMLLSACDRYNYIIRTDGYGRESYEYKA